MRRHAFELDNQVVPSLPVPSVPNIISVSRVGEVFWQGAVGAQRYAVERARVANGEWERIGQDIDEARWPYRPGYVDTSAPIGEKVRYRVIASNDAGTGAASPASAETLIERHLFVDEMDQLLPNVVRSAGVETTAAHPELCKLDRNRLTAKPGGHVVYRMHCRMATARVFAFAQSPGKVLTLSWSSNGRNFKPLPSTEESFAGAVDQPVAFRPVVVSVTSVPVGARELAIDWLVPAEIGRVEIEIL